jgi:hypothetical protein
LPHHKSSRKGIVASLENPESFLCCSLRGDRFESDFMPEFLQTLDQVASEAALVQEIKDAFAIFPPLKQSG